MPSSAAPRHPLARILGWATTVVVGILVAVTLLPSLLGYGRYVIVSGSMTGSYDTGSIVYTKDRPVADLRPGDVITYAPPAGKSAQRLVTHRIATRTVGPKGQPVFRTKGDANQSADPWTFSLNAGGQATVRFGVPYAGYVVSALARPEVRKLVVGVPAALVALLAVVGLLRDAYRESRTGRDDEAEVTSVQDDATPRPVEPYTVFPVERRSAVDRRSRVAHTS